MSFIPLRKITRLNKLRCIYDSQLINLSIHFNFIKAIVISKKSILRRFMPEKFNNDIDLSEVEFLKHNKKNVMRHFN